MNHTHELLQCARAMRYFGLRTPLHNQKLTDEGLTLLDGMLLYINEDWTATKNKNKNRLLRPLARKLIEAALPIIMSKSTWRVIFLT